MLLKEFEAEGDVGDKIAEFVEHFDHHTEFFRDNYYNIIRYLIANAPIIHSPAHGGFSLACNYQSIRTIATDTENFPNTNAARVIPTTPLPQMIPTDFNPPEHTYYRRVLNPLFSPPAMKRRRDAVIDLAKQLIADLRTREQFDFIDDYAKPLTGITSFKLIGLDPATWRVYDTPITNSTFGMGSEEQRAADYLEYEQRVRDAVARAVKDPDPETVIGAMALSTIDDRQISNEEISRTVNTLIIGGLGTTQAVAGSCAVYLARNPERKQELIGHPDRINAAVGEFLRIFSSAPITGRAVPVDIEMQGKTLRAGETVGLFWAAANFDPQFVDRPFEVDFQRNSARSITFAMGPHMCLGQHLARLELEVIVRVLIEDMPNYVLAEQTVVPAPRVASILGFANVGVRPL